MMTNGSGICSGRCRARISAVFMAGLLRVQRREVHLRQWLAGSNCRGSVRAALAADDLFVIGYTLRRWAVAVWILALGDLGGWPVSGDDAVAAVGMLLPPVFLRMHCFVARCSTMIRPV